MTSWLPETCSAAELAEVLGQTERYVMDQVRAEKWPCHRFARREPRFTEDDVRAVLELSAQTAAATQSMRLSLAPRSRQRAS